MTAIATLQIKSLTVTGSGWHKDLDAGTRVLAGAWHQWSFELPPHAVGPWQATADTSGGQATFALPVSAR